MNGFGGGVFDAGRKPTLNSPQNVEVARLPAEVDGPGRSCPAEPSTALITSLFNEGKAAMVFSGPWFLGEIAKGVDYGLAPLPTIAEAGGKPMRPWITVEGVYIAAPSKNKDAAYEFAQVPDRRAGRQGAGARGAADARPTRGSTPIRRWRRIRSSRPSASRWTSPCRCPTCRR